MVTRLEAANRFSLRLWWSHLSDHNSKLWPTAPDEHRSFLWVFTSLYLRTKEPSDSFRKLGSTICFVETKNGYCFDLVENPSAVSPLPLCRRCRRRRRRCRHHRCRLYSEWLSTPTTARETIPASDYDEKQKQVEEVKSKERSRQVKKSVLLFLLVSEQQQQQATWLIV